MPDDFKRNVAIKTRIGDLLAANPVFDGDRLKHVELNQKVIIRTNVIANIIDKYVQDGEKKFASMTLDDATGQLKVKVFGDDIKKFENFTQGDTVMVIGLVRSWNNERYLTPEIIKKKEPAFLLIRKKEIESSLPKITEKSEINKIRDSLLGEVKSSEEQGGIDVEQLILKLHSSPDVINNEIRKLLEEGMIYEPRPGKLRYLG